MKLALIILIVLILTLFWIHYSKEGFTVGESSRTLVELSGGLKTMARIQHGNNGKTVVLLHNSPFDMRIWDSLFASVRNSYEEGIKVPTLIAYDQRGHGTAWEPVDPKYNDANPNNFQWSLETFVEDLKTVLAATVGSGEKIILAGFGFGGVVAQKAALAMSDQIEKLVLLQTSIRPITELSPEITEASDWIAQNGNSNPLRGTEPPPAIPPSEQMVHEMLCGWFYLPNGYTDAAGEKINCSSVASINSSNTRDKDEAGSLDFKLAETIFREGSTQTLLQTDKIIVNTNLEKAWSDAKPTFPIHILAAADDPFASPNRMAQTYTSIYNNNRSILVVMDIVTGKHGFTMTNPDYIKGIICTACKLQTLNAKK